MSRRRVLDALALIRVSRNIVLDHFAIRLNQAEVFARTSSVFKSLRSHTGSTGLSQQFSQSSAQTQHKSVPSSNNIQGPLSKSQSAGIGQDHHYNYSEENSCREPPARGHLDVQQARAVRQPLPDGTIPPANSPISNEQGVPETENVRVEAEPAQHPVKTGGAFEVKPASSNKSSIPTPVARPSSSEKTKQAQRLYEEQIPRFTAEPPSAEADFGPGLRVDQENDTFYQPEGHTSPVLSALPRMKVPKTENDVQGGDSHISSNINADVFYSGAMLEQDMEKPDDETLSQLFHSPRSTQLLKERSRKPSTRRFHTSARAQKLGEETSKQLATNMTRNLEAGTNHTGQRDQAYQMRESRVPSSRIERLFEYGGLAASMAFGAVGERITNSSGAGSSALLSPANLERLVAKLSKMRGAALKLGQMISFQDVKMLPPTLVQVLQRVQDSADYMPASQRDQVIASDLGPEWRTAFQSFEEKPMAAASIGQVHGAVLKDGTLVAMKVQYPGVATSISSDLNNLSLLLHASKLLPKGLYLDKTIANARTELAWECDYVREAEAARKFHTLLADETDIFTVPKIIDAVSGKRVLTMERMQGVAVTKIQNFTEAQKDWIGSQILRLCLREIIEFKYMQTDPNWTNFLYNNKTNKLELLDFGASREYQERFITQYTKVLEAASRGDRKAVGDISVNLGYLTGYESKSMYNAHIDSVMTLAEPFAATAPEVYDFSNQTITDRVRALIPIMVRERLAPPPEETYSLHRKLSGAFLLCARLGSKVRCRELFENGLRRGGFN